MSVVADKEKEKEKTNAVCSLSSNNNNKNVSGNNIKSINRESVEFQEECDRLENCVECQQLLKECLACRDDPTIKELLRQYKQLSGEQDHLRHRASSPSPIQQRNRGMPTKQHYEQKQQQIQPYQQRRYSPLGRQNSNNYGNQRDYQQYHRRSPDGGSSKQIGNYKRQSRSSSQEDRMKYRSNNNSTINRPPSQVPPPPAERKIIPSSTSNSVQQLNKQSKNEPFQRNISRSPDSEHRNRNYQQSKHPSGSMNTGGSYSRNNRNDYQGRYGMQYQPKKYNNSQSRPRRPPSSDRSNSSRSRSRERQATAKKSPRESLRRTNADFDRNKRSPHREISRRSESSSRSNSDSRQRYPSKSKSKSKSRSRSYAKDRSERTSSHRRSSSSSRSSKSSSRRSSSSSHNSTNNNNNNPHHPNLDELQLQIDMQFSKKQQQL